MGEEILKDWQKQVIALVAGAPAVREALYLTGGTALAAYYLQHRISDDLDFFSRDPIDTTAIHQFAECITEHIGASRVRFSRLHDRYQFFYARGDDEAKVEFAHYPFSQLAPPAMFDGIRVDSEYDIATNKTMALLDRFDPKDFVDLYFLIPKFSLGVLREAVEKKFGVHADPLFIGSELAKVGRIVALPKMIAPLSVEMLKAFFSEEARQMTSEILGGSGTSTGA